MAIRITLVGATGWVGKELVRAIAKTNDMTIVAAVSRTGAGKDVGELAGLQPSGIKISGSLAEALNILSDVVIDYTKPNVVKGHVLESLAQGRHVVVGTSGLSDEDYSEIATSARRASRGVLAAGNFSITATLMRRFALEAARYVPDVEVIDYAGPSKADTPSGTARELAELLGEIRKPSTAKPISEPRSRFILCACLRSCCLARSSLALTMSALRYATTQGLPRLPMSQELFLPCDPSLGSSA